MLVFNCCTLVLKRKGVICKAVSYSGEGVGTLWVTWGFLAQSSISGCENFESSDVAYIGISKWT